MEHDGKVKTLLIRKGTKRVTQTIQEAITGREEGNGHCGLCPSLRSANQRRPGQLSFRPGGRFRRPSIAGVKLSPIVSQGAIRSSWLSKMTRSSELRPDVSGGDDSQKRSSCSWHILATGQATLEAA